MASDQTVDLSELSEPLVHDIAAILSRLYGGTLASYEEALLPLIRRQSEEARLNGTGLEPGAGEQGADA